MSHSPQPRVGVGVFVLNSKNQFILGRRKGSHGAGTWALPGGHLEFGESLEECARREVLEETDLDVRELRFLTATNSVFEADQKHYVTVFMVGQVVEDGGVQAEPRLMEPEKCELWEWVTWEDLKGWVMQVLGHEDTSTIGMSEVEDSENDSRRLFLPLIHLIQQRPSAVPQV